MRVYRENNKQTFYGSRRKATDLVLQSAESSKPEADGDFLSVNFDLVYYEIATLAFSYYSGQLVCLDRNKAKKTIYSK